VLFFETTMYGRTHNATYELALHIILDIEVQDISCTKMLNRYSTPFQFSMIFFSQPPTFSDKNTIWLSNKAMLGRA
jgi:hypothetical protein